MKANELRVGNIIETPMGCQSIGGVCQAETPYIRLNGNMHIGYRLTNCKTIPLTEDILLKCEFRKLPKNLYVDDIRDLRTAVTYQNGVVTWNEDTSIVWVGNTAVDNIKYLHQLQNLYFAITGEELKVEL